MIKDTIEKIEKKISDSEALTEGDRESLLKLVSSLDSEVDNLAQTHNEQAESVARFAELSTHEAMRTQKNPDLLKYSLDGLSSSVHEFEASHPKLVQVVNNICGVLSNLGI